MRDRFMAEEIWDNVGRGSKECVEYVRVSAFMQQYTKRLFSRIVPTIKDIGLWGPRIQKAFQDMGVIEFADLNAEELGKADEDVAKEFDKLRASRDAYIRTVAAGEAE